jgi:carbonic anhydrase
MKVKIYFLLASLLLLNISKTLADPSGNALQLLREGNERFVAGQANHPNQTQERMKETAANGQKPFATILACSDSRVPVEVIFDRGIGDLFVVKVAGNVADVDEIATMEYGLEHLGTPVLVVLGHTKCGAVTAVATGAHLEGNLPKLASKITPALEKVKKEHSQGNHNIVDLTIKENVFQTISDILSKSKIISELIEAKKVKIVGAIYDIETGKIDWLGEHPEQEKFVKAAHLTNEEEKATHQDNFFTSKNFIFMGIFIVLVSIIATILIALISKKRA